MEICINKQIDINKTEINNKKKILDSGFTKNGFICQLFNIFKNNKNFCLIEKKQALCEICGNCFEIEDNLYNLYIIINEENIKFDSIELILLYKLVMEGMTKCKFCNFPYEIK